MKYATVHDVEAGLREFNSDESLKCEALLEEAAVIIDSTAQKASLKAKKVVSCRMVRRAISYDDSETPIGTTQGTVSALGYSQTWTVGSGSTGELYLSKAEKSILGVGNRIGVSSPFDDFRGRCCD